MNEQLQRVSLILLFKTAELRFEMDEVFGIFTNQWSPDIAKKPVLRS
jgi:hypothetical protein